MATTLAFRTAPGAVSIPVGQSKTLGAVDVHSFERIRVVADERVGSAGPVVIRLTLTEGNELVVTTLWEEGEDAAVPKRFTDVLRRTDHRLKQTRRDE